MNLRQCIDAMLKHKERLDSPRSGVDTHIAEYQGRRFKCSITTERRGETLQAGGFLSQLDLTIIVRRSELDPTLDVSLSSITVDSDEITSDNATAPPRTNFDITLVTRNRVYRIARVALNAAESHYSLDCVDPYAP